MMRMAEKRILLQTLDQLWKDHLLSLDHLRQGIHLRGYGQRDPLNEYKHEAFTLFEQLLSGLRELVTSRLSHLEIHIEAPQAMPVMPQRKMFESRQDPAMADDDAAARQFAAQKSAAMSPAPAARAKNSSIATGRLA